MAVTIERKLIITRPAWKNRIERNVAKERRIKSPCPFFCNRIRPTPGIRFSRDEGVPLSFFKLVQVAVNVVFS